MDIEGDLEEFLMLLQLLREVITEMMEMLLLEGLEIELEEDEWKIRTIQFF